MRSGSSSQPQVSFRAAAAARLARDLDGLGIPELLGAFPADRPRISDWAAAAESLPVTARPAFEFLQLGRRVDTAVLPASLREFLPVLQAAGILDCADGQAQLADAVLMRPEGLWLFAAPPSPFETGLYFGADSTGLARRLDVRPGSLVLDLCSGTGLQALVAARHGAATHTVEINPAATAVAEVNVALNGFTDRVRLWSGDLYDPLPTGPVYDQVVANLPFLPGVAGGPDGFAVGRAILRGLPARLAPGGTACLTALVLMTSEGAVLPDGLPDFCERTGRGLEVVLGEGWDVDAESGLVQTLADEAAADGDDFDRCAARIADGFRRRGVIAARTAFLRIGAVTGTPDVRFVDAVTGEQA